MAHVVTLTRWRYSLRRPMRHMSKHSFFLPLLALAAVLPLCAHAWEDSDRAIEAWSALSDSYMTPHTEWARPYAGGRLRILYAVASPEEGMSARAREVVELRQRLDAEIDVLYEINFYGANWFGGLAGTRRVSRLLDKAYDVYIFQDVTPGKLPNWPENPVGRFAAAVSNGAGVVILGSDINAYKKPAPDPLAERSSAAQAGGSVPRDAALEFLSGAPVTNLATLGKGRIIELPAPPWIPYRRGWEVEYDHWQEQLIRAVLWAAQKEPPMTLTATVPDPLDRAALPASASLAWRHAAPGTTLETRLRRWDGHVVDLPPLACAQAEGSAALTLPVVPAGRHYLEVRALCPPSSPGPPASPPTGEAGAAWQSRVRGPFTETPVAAWSVTLLTITSASSIASIDITSGRALPFAHVEGGKPEAQREKEEQLGVLLPYFKDGESISGTVRSTGGGQLTVRLCAADDRILMRQTGPDFAFPVESWMPMLMYVEAILEDGANEVASAYRYVRHPKNRRGHFNFILWGYPVTETLAPYAARQLKRMGVDVVYSRWSALSAAAFDLPWLPYTGGQVSASKADSWLDPKAAQYWVNHTGRAASHGALAYSLGDEGSTAGYGTDPATIKSFQAFLRRGYGTIGALNEAWETSFADFGEITAIDRKQQLPPLRDAALPNLAREYDKFDFSGRNFVDMARLHNDLMRAQRDPEAIIGFEGSGEFDSATDPELICRELGFWAPYGGHADELIRSIAPREFIRSNWMGYHQTADGHLSRYYYCLCNGCDSIWYWMWTTIGAWQGFQHPDLSGGVPPVEEFIRDTQFVRDGLGDLLLRYDMQDDGIAMLYSRPSMYVARQKALEPYGPYKWTHLTWHTLIQDLGLQYRYVTDRMLESGEFEAARYRILILPVAHALSDKAADAVRRFAAGGGTVLADLRPGIYDEHARPRDAAAGRGALDDLFGLKAALPIATDQVESTLIEGILNGQALAAFTNAGRETIVAKGVEPAESKALGSAGGQPVCLVHETGKGRAILLNFALWSIMNARTETPNLGGQASVEVTPPPVGNLFLDLFKALGVQPPYALTPYKNNAKARFTGNLELQRWRNGSYEIVSLFRQTGVREVSGAYAQVALPAELAGGAGHRYVYDIRDDVTVGKLLPGWYWIHDILPARAGFYVSMPEPCPPMKVDMPRTARRGAVLKAAVSVPRAGGLHAIKMRITRPDGSAFDPPVPCVLADSKPQEWILPVAFNDPPGAWAITATDVFTHETTQTLTLTVE